jgi:hypothetical protein
MFQEVPTLKCCMSFLVFPSGPRYLFFSGMYLEEGVGRAGTAACDLNSHDYLYIPGGRDGSDVQPGGAFSEPTADKFCGRSLSGLAVTENVDRMRSGYVLDPPDNNTLASTVTSKSTNVFLRHMK